jgi:hypothetical protein
MVITSRFQAEVITLAANFAQQDLNAKLALLKPHCVNLAGIANLALSRNYAAQALIKKALARPILHVPLVHLGIGAKRLAFHL